MLSPGIAREQLAAVYSQDWKERRVKEFAQLRELREIGWGILERDCNGEPANQITRYPLQEAALERLETLSVSERSQVFTVLFPQFSKQVEQAWQLGKRLPYQAGYCRKAFRAPNNPKLTAPNRRRWLMQLLRIVEGYEQDLPWFAAWSPYLGYYGNDDLGILFAAAIEGGDELGAEIFDILLASAKGEHEVGAMGRHVTRALLVADRPDGWEFVEKLLVAAQRQEGLRQTILETIDEAHPEAFRRLVRLIIDRDLTRFSATVRAVDVWFGFNWHSVSRRVVQQTLEQVLTLLEASEAPAAALSSDDAQQVYLALWTLAFKDAIAAIEPAAQLLLHPKLEHRFVATHFLSQLDCTRAKLALLPALEDELPIATCALTALQRNCDEVQTDLFERLEKVLPRFPGSPKTLTPLVWEWMVLIASREAVASALINNLGDRSPKRLIPYLPILDPYERRRVADALAQVKPWDAQIREALFALVGDPSPWVREAVLKILVTCTVTSTEVLHLEGLLTRKAGDLRRGILGLLLNQKDEEAIASAQRLLTKRASQRLAGLELLREMVRQERALEACRACGEAYQAGRRLTDSEAQLLESILTIEGQEPTLADALGLIEPQSLTQPVPPQVQQPRIYVTEAATACLHSLDALVHERRHEAIAIETRQGTEEKLLGNLEWGFPAPNPRLSKEDAQRLPLREVWETWWQERSPELRDEDGLELVRAFAYAPAFDCQQSHPGIKSNLHQSSWWHNAKKTLFIDPALRYPNLVQSVNTWLFRLYAPVAVIDFLLDAVASTLSLVPWQEIASSDNLSSSWELNHSLLRWLQLTRYHRSLFPSAWSDRHQVRFWHLIHWLKQFASFNLSFLNYPLEDVLIACQAGGATEADIIAHLLAAKEPKDSKILSPSDRFRVAKTRHFGELSQITGRKLPPYLAQHPGLADIGDRCRQRILEVELSRGDLPTAASQPALALRSVVGIETLVKLLQVGTDFVRGYTYDSLSKAAVFSRLIRVSFPASSDTPQDFAKQVKAAKIPQERLISLAFYAPQWANYVEQVLKWRNFAEAVWWFHAHTKDSNWHVDRDIRETWEAQVSERTPLSPQILVDGAVDCDWFGRVYKSLKSERWEQLDKAAKYASDGGGHKRAQLFADAMLGRIEKDALVTRITQKRHQDSLRALGLLPLAKGKHKRQHDLLARYQTIQELLRTSRKFGSQRQASEKLAAAIALENLARTAGYPDPQRLEWAMEAEAVADLTQSPLTVTIDEVSVSLAITEGKPELTVLKKGKQLKSIPAKVKKDPKIVELKDRKQEIARQTSRMRLSLEQAMCRGDAFTAAELQQLCTHPVLAPMLAQLIFIGEEDIGYPVQQGQGLQSYNGNTTPIRSTCLRIAHPCDLLANEWQLWQQECFEKQRSQPFKQVFRELYVPTKTEAHPGKLSRRYAGHQVNPRQALALLGKRGWVAHPEAGVRRTFHDLALSAWVTFLDGFFTPTEVEGLTLEGVGFSNRGEWQPLELSEIPPRIFSEVMRDLDLVISVAHQGGVDPEASASTIEMRTALVRETCRLLKLTNVKLQGSHALIEGLNSYSIHLGSGVVHRQPGGALCIIPVSSQHRGRLFLPFADDDPKTAEVVSKVLLLARDHAIQDPTILEQILAP